MILPQRVMAMSKYPDNVRIFCLHCNVMYAKIVIICTQKGKNIGHFDETFFSFYVYSAVRVCSVSIVFSSN